MCSQSVCQGKGDRNACSSPNCVYYSSHHNRVGGKRSSYSPTFVFRPLTPPYMRFLFWVPFGV
ncbi:hypothetical protein F8Q87_15440 [Prevotella copri]|nr:hypothetical protein [Segatella copri]MBM0154657.1 hypothetical protein [Segatella copri]QNT65487.1 hypothetical protein FO447_02460 [Segatella copri]